jgi:hypothetical protein
VKMAGRDRFCGPASPAQAAPAADDDAVGDAGPAGGQDTGPTHAEDGGTQGGSGPGQAAGQEQPARADGSERLEVYGDSAYGSREAGPPPGTPGMTP